MSHVTMAAKKGKMAGRSFTDPILLAPTQTEGEEVRVVREVVPESELPLSQPLFGEGEEEEESGQRSVPPPPQSPPPPLLPPTPLLQPAPLHLVI